MSLKSAAPILRDRNNNIVPLSKRFNLGGSQYLGRSAYERADGKAARVSAKERKLRDAVVDLLRKAGIDVVTESEEGQRVLDMANNVMTMRKGAKKITPETVSVADNQQHHQSVVSSVDGAKILKNLDTLAEKLENLPGSPVKTFLGELGKELGASRDGSKSEYATFETVSGKVVTIRLGDHNAKVSNFDNFDEKDGISIVVTSKPNKGVENDGEAHLTEFYYNSMRLRRAEGKPLADIVRSIKQALYSGEYKDTTGLAEREEVNAEQVRMHRVYHGSGADFERFDHSHMGEGAQAFGWCTYVARQSKRAFSALALRNVRQQCDQYARNK